MNAPLHQPRQAFPVREDCLEIGGVPLVRLAQRTGGTPFYAYERAAITARVDALRTALPAGVRLHYAMKANPMPALVQLMAKLVDGIGVASGGEMKVALDSDIGTQNISFAGPAKSDAELHSAVAAQVLINLESEQEMERVAIAGERVGLTPRVAVRVNADFELCHAGMMMDGGTRQFGVDAARVPTMLHRAGQLGLDFFGFHFFCGAQNLRADAIALAQEKSVRLALQLAQDAPAPLRSVNIGGGLGIPYFPGEQALELAAIGEGVSHAQNLLAERFPTCELVLELGRYLVAEAGIYVCRVLERKLSRGTVFLVTDGGLHHHLAASGKLGQALRKNFPVAIGNRMQGDARERVSIVGPLCTPLDLLADDVEVARAEPGDLVVLFQSGAYGLSASPTAFLGHPLAREVLL